MQLKRFAILAAALFASFFPSAITTLAEELRAPCVPLIACDPYFSVWSNTDELADSFPVHWTGRIHALTSFVKVDGQNYRVMGKPTEFKTEKATQKSVSVRPTTTEYVFEAGGVELTLSFIRTTLPENLDAYSRPAVYIVWSAKSTDGAAHDVAVYFDQTAELCVNNADQEVVAKRLETANLNVLRFGTTEQPILAKKGDDLRIDWGYLYFAVEKGAANVAVLDDKAARGSFLDGKDLPGDDVNFPRPANKDWPVQAAIFNFGKVEANPVEKRAITAYDDLFCLEFLGKKLIPYWRRDGLEALSMLELANGEFAELRAACAKFDADLIARATEIGGEKYASLCSIAYPQSVAAHKLATLPNGKLVLVSKENFSNGCAATVDILYPTTPIFAAFSNELLKATMTPVMEYCVSGRWQFPFAPHDVGTYPKLNGQVYGGGEKTEDNQMPVEESANMLIAFYLAALNDGDARYAAEYWSIISAWADYLLEKGLDPENQLCTDDFAGHLAHNANLSAKAIVALACYAKLCEMNDKAVEAKKYRGMADKFAAEWVKMAKAPSGDHYVLAFDKPDSWSQKYNIVWDKIFDLSLFPADVAATEIEYYKTKLNQYGLPLDNRADYTKLDWQVWTATMANERADFDALMAPVYEYVANTPSRVPLSDWYFTSDAKQRGF
ncbi:MAG: DUF4965 domain-containing protein, partial [Thermoguttaceae bacterium]|nr:DUF4965 domain-containing protein [Thermoguttaceae bacterium]